MGNSHTTMGYLDEGCDNYHGICDEVIRDEVGILKRPDVCYVHEET